MSNQFVHIQHSQTERRSYLGGTTLDEHRELIAAGFRHDRMANHYRRTITRSETYIDAVLQTDVETTTAVA
jgi:hypothetical protein